ncbi:Phosphotransferase system (PTS), EIIB component (glucose-specific) [Alteracholeplasma palmae J233]|uniref:Phosphotransferase system (PTS), EIIB component (Glucose-specific) n=1 Tax=Alteracholeplasma palmae (strain ATCC 49389 / J233) TaxID=1318466 RepID=U4KK74_ALTPJ|nr:phosphotransferase system (PTS), EIIB component (glucose) [Alteracholeplasma palmae]CCV64079.1 Phosphotransferase system (PTS), EIIB component (glucose-specific) [Alteracholeplasma palmae J233]
MNLYIDNMTLIITASAVFAVLILLFLVIFFMRLKKAKTKETVKIDNNYIQSILEALGTKNNIESIKLDNKRLKVLVKDTKKLNQTLFNELDTPAFLVGKELKILVKYSPEVVLEGLNNIRNEEV